jgi:hypothetical protein
MLGFNRNFPFKNGKRLQNGESDTYSSIASLIRRNTSVKIYRTPLLGVKAAALAFSAWTLLGAGAVCVRAQTVSVIPGVISTFAGTGSSGSAGDGGAATAAQIKSPRAIAFDGAGNAYILDTGNYKVRKVTPGGTITTVVGTGTICTASTPPSCGDGGPATSAGLNLANGIYVTSSGVIYIADTSNNEIRMVNPTTGIITTIAGTGTAGSTGNGGLATAALLNGPRGVYVDSTSGLIYIGDSGNSVIRTVNPTTGNISAYAGGGSGTCTGATDTLGDGCTVTSAKFGNQVGSGLWKDAAGNLYVVDSTFYIVRKITPATANPASIVTLVAGTKSTTGFTGDGAAATSAELASPAGVVTDPAGDFFIADYSNDRVRYVNGSGIISTLTGNGTAGFTGDGGLANAAEINLPHGVGIDNYGNIYEVGYGDQRIRVINTLNSQLNFGQQLYNTASASQAVTITDTGAAALTIGSISVPAQYSQVASGGTDCAANKVLQPQGTCQIAIVFDPQTNGPLPGTLTVTTNATNSTQGQVTVALTGTGYYNATNPTTTTLSVATQTTFPYTTPLTTYSGQPVTLSAVVSGSPGPPTGSISFYSGINLLGTMPVNGSGATQVLTTTSLPTGTDSITATYNGDPVYKVSTSAAASVVVYAGPPTVTLTLGTSSYGSPYTVTAGTAANVRIATAPVYGYAGTLTFACATALPADMTCNFIPASETITGTATINSLLSISTTATPPTMNARSSLKSGLPLFLFAPMVLLLAPRKRRRLLVPLCVLCGIGMMGLQGCGSGGIVPQNVTPGTYTITVQAKDSTANLTISATPIVVIVQ